MTQTYTMPSCSCCNRKITPDDVGSVKFRCPDCGDVVHVRCSFCRQKEIAYTCPACDFKGP